MTLLNIYQKSANYLNNSKNKKLENFFKTLKSEAPSSRYLAAIGLGDCTRCLGLEPTLEMVENILPLLEDEDNHVRYYAVEAIGKLGFPFVLPQLRERLKIEKGLKIEYGPGPDIALEKAIKTLEEIEKISNTLKPKPPHPEEEK